MLVEHTVIGKALLNFYQVKDLTVSYIIEREKFTIWTSRIKNPRPTYAVEELVFSDKDYIGPLEQPGFEIIDSYTVFSEDEFGTPNISNLDTTFVSWSAFHYAIKIRGPRFFLLYPIYVPLDHTLYEESQTPPFGFVLPTLRLEGLPSIIKVEKYKAHVFTRRDIKELSQSAYDNTARVIPLGNNYFVLFARWMTQPEIYLQRWDEYDFSRPKVENRIEVESFKRKPIKIAVFPMSDSGPRDPTITNRISSPKLVISPASVFSWGKSKISFVVTRIPWTSSGGQLRYTHTLEKFQKP